MELLLENVKNTMNSRSSKLPRPTSRVATASYVKLAIIIVCSLLFGRVDLFYAVFPCGIALITVLMNKSRANIYTLPLIIAGLMTNYGTGYEIISNLIATILCGIIFFFLYKIRVSIVTRGFFAAGIMVAIKSLYFFMSPLVLVYDVFMMFVEALLILALVYIFHSFFNLLDKDSKTKNAISESIVSTTTVAVLLVGGVGIEMIGPFSPVQLGALMITLFIGYKMGIMEGGIAGIVSGVVTMMISSGSPAVIGIFACAGMVAGFFQGLNRIVTGACFAAVCVAFGLVKGYPELYISIYDPLFAALIFIAIPSQLMRRMEVFFAKIRRDDVYYELVARDRIKDTLKGYLETFEKLSFLYAGKNNDLTFPPYRSKISIGSKNYGALAQWIESQTSNLSVGGSSPSCLTKKNTSLMRCVFLFTYPGTNLQTPCLYPIQYQHE
jgi:stage II sporulation protein E